MIVMVAATLVSIGAGWAVDQLDGDAELHKNDPSMINVVQSGAPVQIAKVGEVQYDISFHLLFMALMDFPYFCSSQSLLQPDYSDSYLAISLFGYIITD